MNKQHILNEIQKGISEGVISKTEIEQLINGSNKVELDSRASDSEAKTSLVTKILYMIGGIIACTGVLSLLANSWSDLGFTGQILITLGLGVVFYISAVILCTKAKGTDQTDTLTQVFFAISAPLMFIGISIWYENMYPQFLDTNVLGNSLSSGDSSSLLWVDNKHIVVGLIAFVIFATALYAFRKKVLHVIATIFFTIAYYALISRIVDSLAVQYDDYSGINIIEHIALYAWCALGIAYVGYGYWIKSKSNFLNKAYYFLGFGSVLLSTLFLGGIWDFLYVLLLIATISLSIKLRTTIGLVLTSVFTGIYCIKISIEYFENSFGFSFVLLFSGILIIALGYLTYYLNKKYINVKHITA